MSEFLFVKYWLIKFKYNFITGPWRLMLFLCLSLAPFGLLLVLWAKIRTFANFLLFASVIVWLKMIAYGIVPLGLAIFGSHYAAEAMRTKRKKALARFTFLISGVLAVLMIWFVEARTEDSHNNETQTLTSLLANVQTQVTTVLGRLTVAAPSPQAREVTRRQDILTLLRQEWILSHRNVSAGLLAGTEQPPAEWVNTRLKQLGENWSLPANVPTNETVKDQLRGPEMIPEISNNELRSLISAYTNELRALERARGEAWSYTLPPASRGPNADDYRARFFAIDEREKKDFLENYRARGIGLRNVLYRRLNIRGPQPGTILDDGIQIQTPEIEHSYEKLADYLDGLKGRLPYP